MGNIFGYTVINFGEGGQVKPTNIRPAEEFKGISV